MSSTLKGKVVLLTGASHGIGRALAFGMAREGADLAVVSRTGAEISALAAELRPLGIDALPLVADVSHRPDVEEMAQATLDHFGRVDVLINNAGIQGVAGRVWEVDPDAWRLTIDINLWGTFLCCRAIVPGMIARRKGRVINVSSGAGHHAMTCYSGYSASKAAITHFTRVLAEEAKPFGVGANAIGVWGVSRLWHEVAEAGEAGGGATRDVANMLQTGIRPDADENVPLAVFLASDASRHITGQYVEANSLPQCFIT
jgi:NAD(P)-dependent dehydrogenase (short-subunit alcohol dehydrogenase family)